MAATAGICDTFKQEVLIGTHNFTVATDSFSMALMTSASTNTPSTLTNYSGIVGEVSTSGTAYAAKVLTNVTPVLNGNQGCVSFSSPITWTASTFTARSAMIYNTTDGNKAVCILDFGGDKTSSAGDFTITLPAQTGGNAIIRIT